MILIFLQYLIQNKFNLDWTRFADNREYASSAYNEERKYDYGIYSDDYNRAFANYQQGVSEKQAAEALDIQQAQLKLQQDAAAAKAAPYSMDTDEEERFFALLSEGRDSGNFADVKAYVDAMRGKGMTDEQAKYWLAFINEEEQKEETPIMQRYGYFNMIN